MIDKLSGILELFTVIARSSSDDFRKCFPTIFEQYYLPPKSSSTYLKKETSSISDLNSSISHLTVTVASSTVPVNKLEGIGLLLILSFDCSVYYNYVCHFQVALSHHLPAPLSPKISQKPDIKRIGDCGEVIFVDGTSDTFDSIIFGTGYNYTFPFFNESCGVRVEEKYVRPLYKHLINIERPTMAIVGIPFQVAPFPLSDLQVGRHLKLTIIITKGVGPLYSSWTRGYSLGVYMITSSTKLP